MKRLAYYFDFIAWPLLALAIVAAHGPSILNVIGIAAWTLMEYGLHRVFLHETAWGRRVHAAHHANPHSTEDVDFVARTLASTAVTFGFLALAGARGLDLLAGIALGYTAFGITHHGMHHWRIRRWHPLYRCKLRHVAHHKIDDCNYGVLTSVWDRVFRTEYVKPAA